MEPWANTFADVFIPYFADLAAGFLSANTVTLLLIVDKTFWAGWTDTLNTVANYVIKNEPWRAISIGMFRVADAFADVGAKDKVGFAIFCNGAIALAVLIAPNKARPANFRFRTNTLTQMLIPEEVATTLDMFLANASTSCRIVDKSIGTFGNVIRNTITNNFIKHVACSANLRRVAKAFTSVQS